MRYLGHEADEFLRVHGCRWGSPREMRWLLNGACVTDYWTGWGGWYRVVEPLAYVTSIRVNINTGFSNG